MSIQTPATIIKPLLIIVILGFCQFLCPFSALATENLQAESAVRPRSYAMVILPFTVSTVEDSYLANGIRDMLVTRLSSLGVQAQRFKAAGADEPKTAADFQKIMAQTSSDYLLSGRYTTDKDGVNITARVYFLNQPTPKKFLAHTASPDKIITVINHLVENIGGEIFGHTAPLPGSLAPQGQVAPHAAVLPLPAGYSHNGRPRTAAKTRPQFTSSPAINLHLRSLGVGDLDGDGSDELVLAGAHKIMVFKVENGTFEKITEFIGSPRIDIVYLSMADLDHDGRQEIYVSAVAGSGPESFALRWQGNDLVYLVKDVDYYLRAMRMIDGKEALVGEKDNGQSLDPVFYEMQRQDSRLHAARRLEVTAPVTIFNFSMVDIDDDRQAEIISRPAAGHLRVMSNSGREIWTREAEPDDFFGSADRLDDSLARLSMAGRLIVRNLDGARGPEFITDEGVSPQDGEIEAHKKIHLLTWTGWAPKELWRTNEIEDDIVDYQLSSFNQNNTILYVGVNISRGIMDIMSPDQCRILMYPVVL
jgi:TolB-like protein